MRKQILLTMLLLASFTTIWALTQASAQDERASSPKPPINPRDIFPATTSAPTVPLDAEKYVLPCYELPADSVADGDLEKWRGVPPAVSAHWFKHNDNNQLITPCDDFSPAIYFGRVKGTDDIMVLVLIKDRCVFGYESASWTFGDNVELFFDFYRQARLKADPGITTQPARYERPDPSRPPDPWNNKAAYAQVGLLPHTPLGPGKMLHSFTYGRSSSVNWNITYASMPVSGGVAYEVKIDGKSALAAIGLDALPEIISIEPVIGAVDYPLLLEAGGWKNHRGYYRTFGDYTTLAYPLRNGAVNTKPLPPVGDELPAETLAAKFGRTAEEIEKSLNRLNPISVHPLDDVFVSVNVEIGELFYWAACNGMKIEKDRVLKHVSPTIITGSMNQRMRKERAWVRQQELIAQAMLSPLQDADTRIAVASKILADPLENAHRALVAACLIAEELKAGDPDKLVALLSHEDMTVTVAAGRALAAVGKKEQAAAFRKLYDEKLAALSASKKPEDRALLTAFRVFVQPPLELLEYRVDPPAEPKTVLRREILRENTDLPRLMPLDNNHVYNGKLARTWPAEGPKELWRHTIGGNAATAVEAGGRAFVSGAENVETEDANGNMVTAAVQFGYCFNAADGELLWKKPIGKGISTYGKSGSPIVDGDRVYFFDSGAVCLNVADGETVWASDAYRSSTFPSAILVGDVLYIPGKSLWAVNKKDGTLLWTSPPDPQDRRDHSPASPAYTEIDSVPVLITGYGNGGNSEIVGVNPADGEVFFRKAITMGWGLCSSPVIDGSRLYVCSGQAGQEFFACYQLFAKDGKVLAMPVFTRTDRQSNYSATLAVWEGAVYGFGNEGLECCDAETGDLLWSTKTLGGLEVVTHLILADGLLLIRTGSTMVLAEANKKEYRELGRFEIPAKLAVQQHTLANGRLYVRGEDTLFVYEVGK